MFQAARDHLNRLSEMDATVAGTAQFIALYIGGQKIFAQIMEKGQLVNPSALATQQANILKTHIHQLLEHCLKLQYFFVGLGPAEKCAVKQFKLKVLALNLVYVVRGLLNVKTCKMSLAIYVFVRKQRISFGSLPSISYSSGGYSEGADGIRIDARSVLYGCI